jgi:uncharacterized protein (TIGR02246 family)
VKGDFMRDLLQMVYCSALLTGAIAAGIGPAVAAQEPAVVAETTAETDEVSADEQQIREAIVKFVELHKQHDSQGIADLFLPNGVMIYSDGEQYEGTEAIQQHFAEVFEQRPAGAISIDVDSIRFLTPEVAIERGVTELFPDGETLSLRAPYTVHHLKRDGVWKMAQVRVADEEVVSAYAALQPLEWLIGDWVDEGRTEVIEATFRWDQNKSFLLEDFQVLREGQIILKGTQRIGWDPLAKQVRSWTFDSAGGFGEATWTEVEDAWVCNARGVSADGIAASVTRTLTHPAEDRVIWSATERISGNERLPDLEVTLVRKPPAPQP